ncbi:MAG: hypothetical protein AAFZ52_18015 [Bacteroidota bacterium]
MASADHHTITNERGEATARIVPIAEYEKMQEIIRQFYALVDFEQNLNESLRQAMQMKAGKRSMPTFQSLLDAL